MWKIVTIVIAVVSVAAAGYLFWDGHQASDDAAALRAETKQADTKAASLDAQSKATGAKTLDANIKVGTIGRASGNMSSKASSVSVGLDLASEFQNNVVAAINPVVNQTPSAATRATITGQLGRVDDELANADRDLTDLKATAAGLQKAAR
jgi:hypothetical protein